MKRLIFLVGLVAAPLFAANTSDNLIKGLELVKNQKADWFNYSKEMHNAKVTVTENEHNKMFDRKINTVKKFKDGNLRDYEQAALDNLVATHESYMNAMRNWHETYKQKAELLAQKHMKDFAQFKESLKAVSTPEVDEIDEIEIEEVELE